MDKIIKYIPFVVIVCLILAVWYVGDNDYSNVFIATFCASVIFMLTAAVYIVRMRLGKTMMLAQNYIVVMLGAGLLTFTILYLSLQSLFP